MQLDFLLDTGSHISVLPADVALELGFTPPADPQDPRLERSIGFGGYVAQARELAHLTFPSDQGPQRYEAPMRITIFPLNIDQPRVPPVLGMDVLGPFRLLVSAREGIVELRDPRR